MHILLVEDNPGDARLIREAFIEGSVPVEVHVVEDGDSALAFLRQEGIYADQIRPDLILLDLNLPGTDGREVLLAVRGDPSLHDIPIVIMTSSQAQEDVSQAVALGVERFVRKPNDLDTYMELMQDLAAWWGPNASSEETKTTGE